MSDLSHLPPPIPGSAPHLSHLSYWGEVEVGDVNDVTSPHIEEPMPARCSTCRAPIHPWREAYGLTTCRACGEEVTA